MSKNVKISIGLVLGALVAVALVVVLTGQDDDQGVASTDGSAGRLAADAPPLVREDSQRLSTATEGDTTFVEFLDFECEACGAAYPAIEELRETYGDQITFVVRYFPLHANSEGAFRAAEGAAAQGKFEEMYSMLFENQTDWAEQSTPQDDVFFGYAEELGLDMDEFRAVYDDPAILEKIERDKADGIAAGVTGTPTFFLDGNKVEVTSFAELTGLIDASLAD